MFHAQILLTGLSQAFQKFDVDGDGRLNYSEFKAMMKIHK